MNPLLTAFIISELGAASVLLFMTIARGFKRIMMCHGGWPTPASRRANAVLHTLLSTKELRHLAETGYIDIPGKRVPDRNFRISAQSEFILVRDVSYCRACLHIPFVQPLTGRARLSAHILLLRSDEIWVMHHAEHMLPASSQITQEVLQYGSA